MDFLVDSASYFRFLETALAEAEREIWIIGWDFNADIRLRPDKEGSERLGDFLVRLAEERPSLVIRILVWSMGPIYSGKSLRMFEAHRWSTHPRIDLRFDTTHAIRGAHHQKLVCIDDQLACVGGMDLTAKRWDTSEHLAQNPLRCLPDGETYEPVHDVQAVVAGEAAKLAGALARRRWQFLTGEAVPPCETRESRPSPKGTAALRSCEIGFARTEPAVRGREGCGEALQLTFDALRAARRNIYIENQYFASEKACRILCEKLKDPDGPDVVVVTTRNCHGILEKLVMGENRDRFLRRMRQNDLYGRLRAGYPVVPSPDGGEQEVVIHSKLVVVDDQFLRVGSSNLNRRSEELDSELDIAIEASRGEECRAITELRNRLLGEHLDVDPRLVASVMAETNSLAATYDRLNKGRRGLRPFKGMDKPGKTEPVFGTSIVDPARPWWPLQAFMSPAVRLIRRFRSSWRLSAGRRSISLMSRDNSPKGSGMKK